MEITDAQRRGDAFRQAGQVHRTFRGKGRQGQQPGGPEKTVDIVIQDQEIEFPGNLGDFGPPGLGHDGRGRVLAGGAGAGFS